MHAKKEPTTATKMQYVLVLEKVILVNVIRVIMMTKRFVKVRIVSIFIIASHHS